MKTKIKVFPLSIQGTYVIVPTVMEDVRGFFFEAYNKKEFHAIGITDTFVQENHIGTKKNGIRGLHFQRKPYAQSKLVRCFLGEVFDVVVDLRQDSSTFGKWESVVLSPQNRKMVYMPAGCAHGVLGLSDWSEVAYSTSQIFMPEYDAGVRWDDPDLNIQWPIKVPLLSDKDSKQPFLKELKGFL